MVLKKKEKNVGHKNNRWKVWTKTIIHIQHATLKYNPMGNNVEGICNVYLQQHPNMMNIWLFKYHAPLPHKLPFLQPQTDGWTSGLKIYCETRGKRSYLVFSQLMNRTF